MCHWCLPSSIYFSPFFDLWFQNTRHVYEVKPDIVVDIDDYGMNQIELNEAFKIMKETKSKSGDLFQFALIL